MQKVKNRAVRESSAMFFEKSKYGRGLWVYVENSEIWLLRRMLVLAYCTRRVDA